MPQRHEIQGLRYTSPYAFSGRQRVALLLAPPLVALGLKALVRTCRIEVRNRHFLEDLVEREGRAILAVWHESMGLGACHYCNSGYHTLTSYSFDGELAARVVRHFGMRALRGSSSKGGADALDDLAIALDHGPAVGFTPDGPRGPRRVAKPGIAILAARTGTPIVPHAFDAHPAWRLHSWDRSLVPKPGARVVSAYGPPLTPPENSTPEAVERMRVQVEEALNKLHAEVEAELGPRA